MENISKYLDDKRFIQWVFSPGNELNEWWNSFKAANPKEKENIQLARRILQKLHTSDRELSEDEKIMLFSQILKQVEAQQEQRTSRKIFMGLMKYAAVAILFFSVGALLFYQKNNFNPQFITQEISEPVLSDEARLIRPGGENILLSETNSRIEHRQDGQVVVNNNVIEPSTTLPKGTPEMNQLVIPYGKTSEILLPDGTHVFLNAGSRLIYPDFFADRNREVFLVGEAYFEVMYNEKQPFVVQTTDIRVRVLGTQFNVSAYPSDNIIETVLTSGKVTLEQNHTGMFSETTELVPGQLAAFSKTERTIRLKEVDIENYTLWKEGLLKFESTDLSRVVKRLERYYNIRFKYNDPFLGGIKISGKLDLSDSREFVLKNVADAATVEISKIGEGYYEISN
jgi:ferric-dicitrate binding protein FerR (iron transport regulator)